MQLHLMEGTAWELHSLTSTFSLYALYLAPSHNGNRSDVWHSVAVILFQSSWISQHWQTPQNACCAVFAAESHLLSSLRGGSCRRVVLENGVTHCVPVTELTHLLLTVTCHLHETMQCYCSLGHSIGYVANCNPFSSAWQTSQVKLESEAPNFRVSTLLWKERKKRT